MKKRFLLFIMLCCILLTGCSTRAENIHIYGRSTWRDDSTDILIDKKYTLKDYQKEYTEDGCTIIINYVIADD